MKRSIRSEIKKAAIEFREKAELMQSIRAASRLPQIRGEAKGRLEVYVEAAETLESLLPKRKK